MTTFYEFGLNNQVVRALENMGYEEATPIQNQAIPIALEGRDLIGKAQTGTGKTAAFGIPLTERLNADHSDIQGIVLTPTRELAVQVSEEINKIARFKGIRALAIYGGQEIDRQIKALKKKPQIIVATPGRLMDHMRRKTVRLHSIEIVVLDEADQMLNMGFIEDIQTILQEVPNERQTLLFSATMPKPIQELAQKFMSNPEMISISPKELTVPSIDQEYLEVPEKQKFDILCRLLDIQKPDSAIIFGRTKRRVEELSEALDKYGYKVEGIHGDLTQSKRDQVLRKFKEGKISILVATDVAARGLDIIGVTHIYNFDIPHDPESYVHRIGRTGRAGNKGKAITFVTPAEAGHLKAIEQITKRKIEKKPVPTMAEVVKSKQRATTDELFSVIGQGGFESYQPLAKELLEKYDSVTLMAAALKMMTKEPIIDSIQLTEEPPLRVKSEKRTRRKQIIRENYSKRENYNKRDNFSKRDHHNKRGKARKKSPVHN